MPSLQQSAITNAGRHLISKGIAGHEIKFTRIAIGSGHLPTGHKPEDQAALIQPVINVDIIKLLVLGGGQIVVGGKFSNAGITTGFYYREVGLFAEDPDAGEILYSYGNAGTLAEWIDPAGTSNVISKSIDIRTTIENASSVTAEIRPESDISIEMFEEHTKNQQNPHKVTAEQIDALPKDGTSKDSEDSQKLGGQLPNYYAKQEDVKKHIDNKNNPHETDKNQIGLGNVDNTADADKSVQYAKTAGNAKFSNAICPKNANGDFYANNGYAIDIRYGEENMAPDTNYIFWPVVNKGNDPTTFGFGASKARRADRIDWSGVENKPTTFYSSYFGDIGGLSLGDISKKFKLNGFSIVTKAPNSSIWDIKFTGFLSAASNTPTNYFEVGIDIEKLSVMIFGNNTKLTALGKGWLCGTYTVTNPQGLEVTSVTEKGGVLVVSTTNPRYITFGRMYDANNSGQWSLDHLANNCVGCTFNMDFHVRGPI